MIGDVVGDLINNKYSEAVKIGQAGKQTALKEFSYERYCADWLSFIENVLLKKI